MYAVENAVVKKTITANKIALFTTLLLGAQLAQALDAGQIMEENYNRARLPQFTGNVKVTLYRTGSEPRVRDMSVVSKLDSKNNTRVLTRFKTPADLKNASFLNLQNADRDDDVWVYLPALGKSRRILSKDKKDSFFGTDFTYQDISPDTPDNFVHTSLPADKGETVIESTPKTAALVESYGFAKKRTWLNPQNYLESHIVYFDKSGKATRQQTVSGWQSTQNNRWVATQRQMENLTNKNRTAYNISNFSVTTPVADTAFTVRALENP